MVISWPVVVQYMILFIASSQLLGGGLKAVIFKLFGSSETSDSLESFVVNVALFITFVPILGLLLSIFKLFDFIGTILATAVLGTFWLSAAWSKVRRWRFLTARLHLMDLLYYAVCATLFVTAMLVRFQPTVGLYVLPGDDPFVYSFLTSLILKNHEYTFDLGYQTKFAQSLIYYPYAIGFPGLNAFMSFLTSLPAPTSTTMTTMAISSLFPLAMLYYCRTFFGKIEAVTAAFSAAIVTPWPLNMFIWGGNAEYLYYFLGPIIIVEFIRFLKGDGNAHVVVYSVLVAGALLGNAKVVMYVFPVLLLALIYYTVRSRSWQLIKYSALAIGLVSALVAYPVYQFLVGSLLPYVRQEGFVGLARGALTEGEWSNVIFTHNFDINIQWLEFMFFVQSPKSLYYLYWTPVIVLPYLVFLLKKDNLRLGAALAGLWLLFLFVLAENSPKGLYFIAFPLQGNFIPSITSLFMMVPLTIMQAIAVGIMVRRTFHHLKLNNAFRRVISLVLVALLITGLGYSAYLYYQKNSSSLLGNRANSSLSQADISAFEWIRNNVPINATFLINGADGGAWIHEFTGRQVLPLFQLISGRTAYYNMTRLRDCVFYIDCGATTTEYYLKYYDVSYLYVGSKTIYGRNLPSITRLSNMSYLINVYAENGVYIYRVNIMAKLQP